MYVDDVGSAFGEGGFIWTRSAGFRADYEGWKKRRVWRNSKADRQGAPAGIGGSTRPLEPEWNPGRPGEAGRRSLAGGA